MENPKIICLAKLISEENISENKRRITYEVSGYVCSNDNGIMIENVYYNSPENTQMYLIKEVEKEIRADLSLAIEFSRI